MAAAIISVGPIGEPRKTISTTEASTSATTPDPGRRTIATTLRSVLSPRHVPDVITAVPSVPRNRTGKKLELPVKKLLRGARLEDVASRDVLADPRSLEPFLTARRPS